MDGYFLGIGFTSIIFFIIGLINPLLVNSKNRKYVALIFPAISILSYLVFYFSNDSGSMIYIYLLLGILTVPVALEVISQKQNKIFNTKYSVKIESYNYDDQGVQYEIVNNELPDDLEQPMIITNKQNNPRMIGGLIYIIFGCVIVSMINIYSGGYTYPILLLVYLLVEMIKYRKRSINFLKVYFVFTTISCIAKFVFSDYYGVENLLEPVLSLLLFGSMLIYTFKSKRVKETFIL